MKRHTRAQFEQFFSYAREVGKLRIKKARRNTKNIGAEPGWIDEKGYRRFFFERRLYFVHIVIWFLETGSWPVHEVDHYDGARQNNRFGNLRAATPLQNGRSQLQHKDSKSPFKGITLYKNKTWQAQICVNRKHVHLGYRKEAADAARLYDLAALKHFGKFAKTNAMLGLL